MKNWALWYRATFLVALTVIVRAGIVLGQQPADEKTIFSDAEYYFLFQDYSEAVGLYQQLLETDPENANLNYRVGVCYLNMLPFKLQAIPYLEKATKNIKIKYREGSFKENAAPVDALLQLGNAYRIANRLDESVNAYTQYAEQIETKDIYSYDFVQQQIEATQRAKFFLAQPIPTQRTYMGVFEEVGKRLYGPVQSANGQFLVVTVQEKFYDAIYISHKNGDTWSEPINITLDLGVEGETYATSISADGAELFLFKNDRGVGNIYTSHKIDGAWQKVTKLGGSISSRYWETHAAISADGQSLYFTSNRRGGYGGLDIYVSHRLPNNEWGPAQNMGPTINTPFNEETPFLSPDGTSLIFASQGHEGMGGFDIFCSQKLEAGHWAKPTNMGYPISTTDDDLFYFPVSEKSGLLSVPFSESVASWSIQMVQIEDGEVRTRVPIVGRILTSDNEEIEMALFNISLKDKEKNEIVATVSPSNLQGDFTTDAYPGTFALITQAQGYLSDTTEIFIAEQYNRDSYPVSIRLTPEAVAKGEAISLRSIQFAFDKHNLSREAQFEMERILLFMEKYPSVVVEVAGHTDSKGSVKYNNTLSLQRAEAVISYLKSRGVEANRMVARAAGYFENVASNVNPDGSDNPEGRAYNRRATISLINSDEMLKISDELQVPEYLKPQFQDFTILLVPYGHIPREAALAHIKRTREIEPNIITSPSKGKAFTLGKYSHKSDAIELLNFCIENGFPDAALVGLNDLKAIMSKPSTSAALLRSNKGQRSTLALTSANWVSIPLSQ